MQNTNKLKFFINKSLKNILEIKRWGNSSSLGTQSDVKLDSLFLEDTWKIDFYSRGAVKKSSP